MVCIFYTTTSFAGEETWKNYTYTAIKVLDGDTIRVTDGNIKSTLRIASIDAPEKSQAYGKVAKYHLQEMVLDKKIKIKPVGRGLGKYGRVIGMLYVDGVDVGLEMIKEGLATYYRPSCKDFEPGAKNFDFDPRVFVEAEIVARNKNLKYWGMGAKLPCEFRKSKKNR